MRVRLLNRGLDILAVTLILFLANFRALRFIYLFPATDTIGGQAWREIAFWILTAGLVAFLIQRFVSFKSYVDAWKKNWLLILFIGLTFMSVAWSRAPIATMYRALELLLSTLLGAYIGIRYNLRSMLNILFWFGVIVVISCYAFALLLPGAGTMLNYPYNGAWNGIFWHRNHMGSILALLNCLFLIRLILEIRDHKKTAFVDGVLYLLAALLVFLSRSATGYILALGLNFLIAITTIWLAIKARLRLVHYLAAAGIFGIGVFLATANAKIIFGLLNRDTSLTGRVPLWIYLLNNISAQRPWLGYGFGAIWTMESFRVQVQHVVGWLYPVLISDNGFLDILLHLGGIGLFLFLVILGFMGYKTGKFGFKRLSLEGFLPFIIIIYALAANISFSLFLETESFVWLLMVAALFLTAN